jgi:hypothetical protein
MATSRRLEPAATLAADCCRLGVNPKADSAQQQPAKTIPAVAPDKSLRNSLRVGMVAFLSSRLAVVHSVGEIYHGHIAFALFFRQ